MRCVGYVLKSDVRPPAARSLGLLPASVVEWGRGTGQAPAFLTTAVLLISLTTGLQGTAVSLLTSLVAYGTSAWTPL